MALTPPHTVVPHTVGNYCYISALEALRNALYKFKTHLLTYTSLTREKLRKINK